MGTFGIRCQRSPCSRRSVMNRRAPRSDARVVQPMLPLGHADVCWEALPPRVQVEVLARWCEMLQDVMRPAGEMARADEGRS